MGEVGTVSSRDHEGLGRNGRDAGFEFQRRRVMVRHQQAFHQFTLDHVSFHDFSHVGFIAHPIPDSFRINDDARTIFAMIQAPRLVGANHVVESEPPDFLFEEGVKFHGSIVRATSPGISCRALVDADKDMMFESTHVSVSFFPSPLEGEGRGEGEGTAPRVKSNGRLPKSHRKSKPCHNTRGFFPVSSFSGQRLITYSDPIVEAEGVRHDGVTNISGMVPQTATYALTNATRPFIVRVGQRGKKRGSSGGSRMSPRSQRLRRGNHLPGGRGGTRVFV